MHVYRLYICIDYLCHACFDFWQTKEYYFKLTKMLLSSEAAEWLTETSANIIENMK